MDKIRLGAWVKNAREKAGWGSPFVFAKSRISDFFAILYHNRHIKTSLMSCY